MSCMILSYNRLYRNILLCIYTDNSQGITAQSASSMTDPLSTQPRLILQHPHPQTPRRRPPLSCTLPYRDSVYGPKLPATQREKTISEEQNDKMTPQLRPPDDGRDFDSIEAIQKMWTYLSGIYRMIRGCGGVVSLLRVGSITSFAAARTQQKIRQGQFKPQSGTRQNM